MTSMKPGGIVTNVSKGYGCKVSDKTISNQNNMEPHINSIMMERGFLFKDECRNSYIGSVRPPFAKGGKLSGCPSCQ